MSTLSTEVLARLGLPEGSDETAVLAAIDGLKAQAVVPDEPNDEDDDVEVVEPVTMPDPTPQPPAEPVPASPASQVSAQYAAELARVSAELAEIKAQKAADDKRALFDSVVAAGKIAPSDRKAWEARYDKAPDVTADILASFAPGTAVPVQAAGHTGGNEEADIDGEYEKLVAGIDGPAAKTGV